jgi:hypothetical protein
MRRLAFVRALGAATAGAGTWVVGTSGSCSTPPSLSGHYELASSSRGLSRQMTGHLTYSSDGQMHTALQDGDDEVHYSGRWWVQQPDAAGRPPHGNQQVVEHQVQKANCPYLVGQTVFQTVHISDDGSRLTTADVRIVQGKLESIEQLEWRRMRNAVPP